MIRNSNNTIATNNRISNLYWTNNPTSVLINTEWGGSSFVEMCLSFSFLASNVYRFGIVSVSNFSGCSFKGGEPDGQIFSMERYWGIQLRLPNAPARWKSVKMPVLWDLPTSWCKLRCRHSIRHWRLHARSPEEWCFAGVTAWSPQWCYRCRSYARPEGWSLSPLFAVSFFTRLGEKYRHSCCLW